MLIGCCLNTLAKGNDLIGIEQLELMVKTGYDYIDLPLAQMMMLSDSEFDALLERVKRAEIPCRSCNNLFPTSMRITGRNVDYDAIRTYLEKAFCRARRLGVSVIVFGSPASRNVEEGFPRELAVLQFLKAIHIVDEYTSPSLQIALEHVCKREGNLIYTVEENCLVHEVCRTKNVGILADTYHMAVEGEPLEQIALAGSNLLHVHTANPNGRIYPAENDGVDYKKMADTLKSIQYAGGISVEAFAGNLPAEAAAALSVLRKAIS